MPMAAVAMTTPVVSTKLQRDQERDGLIAQSTMTGAISSVPLASASHRAVQLAMGFARPTSLARTRPAAAMAALIIAVGANVTRANLATPSGVANVSLPWDQRLISQAPVSAAIGVPSALLEDQDMEPPPMAVAKNPPTKIAGQIR